MFGARLQVDVVNKKRGKNDSQIKRFSTDESQSVYDSCRENWHQYLINTTLHGLKYVGDRKISRFER